MYEGRNGSEGIIVGKAAALAKWINEVDGWLKQAPIKVPRPWVAADGGKENLVRAQKAADRVFRGLRFEFITEDGSSPSGDYVNGKACIVNAHTDDTHEVGGHKVHSGSQIAAHEAAHAAYAHNPKSGKQVTEALIKWGKRVSTYHGLAGHFEGTMDAISWWALVPGSMKSQAPELFDVIENWLG